MDNVASQARFRFEESAKAELSQNSAGSIIDEAIPQESEERWAVLARQLPKVEDLLKVLQATFASHLIWLQIAKCYGGYSTVAVFACQGAIWN